MTSRSVLVFFIAYLLSSCSSRRFIVTDEVAYYPEDDSISVFAELEKNRSLENQGDTAKTDTANVDTTNMIPPSVIEREEPDYPECTVGQSSYLMEGNVSTKVWVAKEGNVKRAYIIKSSEKVFNKPCLEAAMKWKFNPAISNGKPVSVWVLIPFRFRLYRPEDRKPAAR
jgi:TonB family protein